MFFDFIEQKLPENETTIPKHYPHMMELDSLRLFDDSYYVIGGNNEYDNLTIANKICTILNVTHPKKKGKYQDQISFVEDRLGHDRRYAIDATKIRDELGWKPMTDFDKGLQTTIAWFSDKQKLSP